MSKNQNIKEYQNAKKQKEVSEKFLANYSLSLKLSLVYAVIVFVFPMLLSLIGSDSQKAGSIMINGMYIIMACGFFIAIKAKLLSGVFKTANNIRKFCPFFPIDLAIAGFYLLFAISFVIAFPLPFVFFGKKGHEKKLAQANETIELFERMNAGSVQ